MSQTFTSVLVPPLQDDIIFYKKKIQEDKRRRKIKRVPLVGAVLREKKEGRSKKTKKASLAI